MDIPVVKCRICWEEFDGDGALRHKEVTGHNRWMLLIPEKRDGSQDKGESEGN